MRESVLKMSMQRPLTAEERQYAWQQRPKPWLMPIIGSFCAISAALASLSGDILAMFFLAVFTVLGVTWWMEAVRLHRSFNADIEAGKVEELEGAPERVWMKRRGGPCYVKLSGCTIRIPRDDYKSLKGAYIARVAFLPLSHISIRVDAKRGIGFC